MRQSNSVVSKYTWYDARVIDDKFILSPTDDTHVCIFCHEHAPNSIYYPTVRQEHLASSDVIRMRARVCNNHYQSARKLVQRTTFPVPFEVMHQKFGKKRSAIVGDTQILPGWFRDPLTRRYCWGSSEVDTPAFIKFQEFIHENGLLFKLPEHQAIMFTRFSNTNPDISIADMKIFEMYIYNGGERVTAITPKCSSLSLDNSVSQFATMFD